MSLTIKGTANISKCGKQYVQNDSLKNIYLCTKKFSKTQEAAKQILDHQNYQTHTSPVVRNNHF